MFIYGAGGGGVGGGGVGGGMCAYACELSAFWSVSSLCICLYMVRAAVLCGRRRRGLTKTQGQAAGTASGQS